MCASGSHVWNGNIGTLTAKPINMPAKIQICTDRPSRPPCSARYAMLKLASPAGTLPDTWKYSAKKATSMSAEPNIVYKKNFSDAY